MNQEIFFDGAKYISSKQAAKKVGYANDYIGQLCRDGKLVCRMVGRSWYVEYESLILHKKENSKNGRKRGNRSKSKNNGSDKISEKNYIRQKLGLSDNNGELSLIAKESNLSKNREVFVGQSPLFFKKIKDTEENNISYELAQGPRLPRLKKEKTKLYNPNHFRNLVTIIISLFVIFFSVHNFLNTYSPKLTNILDEKIIEVATQIDRSVISIKEDVKKTFTPVFVEANYVLTQTKQKALATAYKSFSFLDFTKESLSSLTNKISSLVGLSSPTQINQNSNTDNTNIPSSQNGMVVFPIDKNKSAKENSALVSKVQNSFSDEVNVSVSEDGTTGVITPVFKNKAENKDNYAFVLVPIKN